MTDERKFSGRLQVKPSIESKVNKSDVKFQSPLRRIPVVRFQFTTPPKIADEIDCFGVALDRILKKIGIISETVNLDDSFDDGGVSNSVKEPIKSQLSGLKRTMNVETTMSCEECKKRKLKVFTDVGSQCVEANEMVSIATQVNEDELMAFKVTKNESLALLTPAQLLNKEKEKESAANENLEKEEEKLKDSNPTSENNTPSNSNKNFKNKKPFRKGPPPRFGYNDYDEYQDYEYGEYDEMVYQNRRDIFTQRLGPPLYPAHPPLRQFGGGPSVRLNQLGNGDGPFFTDFSEPNFRGRNPSGRFGPRY